MKDSPRFYLLIGDAFLRDQKYQEVLSAIQKSQTGTCNIQKWNADEVEMAPIFKEAHSLPFLCDYQIFRIQEADAWKEKELDPLEAYFQKPSEKTWMIFEAEHLPPTHRLNELIRDCGQVLTLEDQQKASGAMQWIKEKSRQYGKTVHPIAARRIMEWMGDQPVFLNSFLEQVFAYAADRDEITEDIIILFEEKWQEIDTFALVDAISNRQLDRALKLLHQILENSDSDEIALLGMLHWMIKRFWKAAYLKERGESEDRILKACKINYRQASFFWKQLRGFSKKQLEDSLELLFRKDMEIKTGVITGTYALEQWLIETLNSPHTAKSLR